MNQQEEITKQFGNKLRVRAAGICLENNKLLLIKHVGLASGYFWSPPGGGVSFGETTESSLKREFKEETGLEIEVNQLLCVNEFLHPPLHAIELFFSVTKIGGAIEKGYDPEMSQQNQLIEEVRFLSLEEIQQEAPERVHRILHQINQIEDILKLKGYLKNT